MLRPVPPKRDLSNLVGLRGGLYCRVSKVKDKNEKSVEDQEAIGRPWFEANQVVLVDVYRDPDRSASRFATRQRENYNRLIADIEAGKLDLIWFWEMSRSQRDLAVYVELRELCRDFGVVLVVGGRPYDPNDYKDMLGLGILSVTGELESEQTSERVLRGKRSSAYRGRPPGRKPYGYRRVYEDKKFVRDEADVFDDDGRPIEDSPAWVVAEIFRRLAAGESVRSIRIDLNARGVRTARGFPWYESEINYIAQNPTYIARRFHQAGKPMFDGRRKKLLDYSADRRKKILVGDDGQPVKVQWPALIDEATFWAVQRRYAEQARTLKRPDRAGHLLSGIVWCAKCGAYLSGHNARQRQTGPVYMCRGRSCVGIYERELDRYVETLVVRWLTDKAPRLLTRRNDSAAAARARGDAEQLRVQLGELYRDAEAGEVSPTIATLREKRLLEGIDEADARAEAAALPSELAGVVGPQAAARWVQLDLAVKRRIIAAVADVRVRPVGRGRKSIPASQRVDWRWLLGPDGEALEVAG